VENGDGKNAGKTRQPTAEIKRVWVDHIFRWRKQSGTVTSGGIQKGLGGRGSAIGCVVQIDRKGLLRASGKPAGLPC
jgi:hypothetical protein